MQWIKVGSRLAAAGFACVILATHPHEYSVEEAAGAALAATLETLPSDSSLETLSRLNASMSPATLSRLESTARGVVQQVEALIEHYSPYSFSDFREWDTAVRAASTRISDDELLGKWKCREMHINSNGSFALPYEDCEISVADGCVDLDQTSGSVPMAGCLHRLDDRHFVFLQTRKLDRDNEPVEGFLSGSSRTHLRMVSIRTHSMDVHEFVRADAL